MKPSRRLSICRKGSASPVAERGFPAERKTGRTEIFWRGIPELDGEYVCTVSFPGLKNVTASQAFIRRRFPWEHNKLGRSDAVPAPFTPVVRKGDPAVLQPRAVQGGKQGVPGSGEMVIGVFKAIDQGEALHVPGQHRRKPRPVPPLFKTQQRR